MLNLNRAQILGNLTRDPEMRFTGNGQAVSNFSVATNRRWTNRDSGEKEEQVEFHNVVIWGKQAESVSPMLKKGNPVFVEGRIQTRSWEGQDGVKRYRSEIVADSVIVLTPRPAGSAVPEENPAEEVAAGGEKTAKKKDDKPAPEPKSDAPKGKDSEVEEIDIEDIPF